jgi:hypothetical protein
MNTTSRLFSRVQRYLRLCSLASLLIVFSTASAWGDFAIVQLITNVGTGGGLNPAIGWEFTPVRPIQVTKLGYYDAYFDGLLTSHELGIFEVSGQTLLTSSIIEAGVSAPLEGPSISGGGFRYVSTAPVVLMPGSNYIMAATPVGYIDQTADFSPTENGHHLETAPDITYIQGRYNFFEPPGLEFPEDTFAQSTFGPSFQFVVVPEPSAVVLAAIGMAFVALAFRRKSA